MNIKTAYNFLQLKSTKSVAMKLKCLWYLFCLSSWNSVFLVGIIVIIVPLKLDVSIDLYLMAALTAELAMVWHS